MKTRIVYPKMWFDEKFTLTEKETKVLFNYLINCNSLGLSRYHRITDRQMLFDTGIKPEELETAKKQLTELKWCFFKDDWVYHNHDCAYVSYGGRDIVMASKAKEISEVPQEIKDYFNPLITRYELVKEISSNVDNEAKVNPLTTGRKPLINHKQEIINDKSETRNSKGFQSAKEIANKLRVKTPKN